MFSLVQSLSPVQLFVNPRTAARQAPLSITNFWSLLEHDHRVSDAIQSSHPLLSPSPPAFDLSQHQVLCLRWPKYYSFSFSISPSNEYSGRISFRIDWLDLLAVQGTLKSLLQESVMPSSHLILCRPLLLLPSIFPSFRVFSDKSVLCITWPEYWSFSFNISPSNEYSGRISFKLDWLLFQICWHTECSTLTAASFRRPCKAWLM